MVIYEIGYIFGDQGVGMQKLRKSILIVIISALFPLAIQAEHSTHIRYSHYGYWLEPGSGEAMVADALIARPVGVVTTVVGSAVYVVSLPFSLLGGNERQARQKLVIEPAEFTFKRPLGEY